MNSNCTQSCSFSGNARSLPLVCSPARGPTLVGSSLAGKSELGCIWMALANALSYYNTTTITIVKCSIVWAPCSWRFVLKSVKKVVTIFSENSDQNIFYFVTEAFSSYRQSFLMPQGGSAKGQIYLMTLIWRVFFHLFDVIFFNGIALKMWAFLL